MKKLSLLAVLTVSLAIMGISNSVHAMNGTQKTPTDETARELVALPPPGEVVGPLDGKLDPKLPSPGHHIVPAPIESVEVVASGPTPTGHALQIVAGLPGGCVEPFDFGFLRFGHHIYAYVWNTEPLVPGSPCTLEYRTYDVTIDLGTDFVPGERYTAIVNGRLITFVAHGGIVPASTPDKREEIEAPIESVDVRVLESSPPQYVAEIVAGLPSGCTEPGDHNVNREGTRISIDVTNTVPAADPPCTMIYKTYDLNVDLGTDFTPGETYTVDVNGTTTQFTAEGEAPESQGDVEVVPAPIDLVEVLTLPSLRSQYVVRVVAGLPSGCAEPDDYEVTREGGVISIEVTNTMPAGDPVCTMIYGTYELHISIGSNFEAGHTYTVDVNGTVVSFVP